MSNPTRPFEPVGSTQSVAMDGTAKSLTVAAAGGWGTSVFLNNVGTQVIFFRLDGTTAATATGVPLQPGTCQVFSRTVGNTTVKAIGAAGSTLYVTEGLGA